MDRIQKQGRSADRPCYEVAFCAFPTTAQAENRSKVQYPGKEIWCYTGYTLAELRGDSRARCEATDEMLSLIDVLVDGPFVEAQKDLNLRFRGSANQRILNVPASLKAHSPVLWDGELTVQSITI